MKGSERKSLEKVGAPKTIGERIREKRKAMRYSQEKLAELLMIKQNTLSNYESNERDIPTDILSETARILKTTPSYLVWGNEGEDGWMDEIRSLAGNIKSPSVREAALSQLLALVQLDAEMPKYHKL